jgi:hypothetical protein
MCLGGQVFASGSLKSEHKIMPPEVTSGLIELFLSLQGIHIGDKIRDLTPVLYCKFHRAPC